MRKERFAIIANGSLRDRTSFSIICFSQKDVDNPHTLVNQMPFSPAIFLGIFRNCANSRVYKSISDATLRSNDNKRGVARPPRNGNAWSFRAKRHFQPGNEQILLALPRHPIRIFSRQYETLFWTPKDDGWVRWISRITGSAKTIAKGYVKSREPRKSLRNIKVFSAYFDILWNKR